MSQRVGVIDYGGGNLRNVLNVLRYLGREGSLVSAPEHLEKIDRLVFPGVGAFGDCVDDLDRKGLRAPLRQWLEDDRPYFGICLGYQVLFERSAESPDHEGLGFFRGGVKRFDPSPGLKIPHMGWNEVEPKNPDEPPWTGSPEPLHLYFVHSYHPVPDDEAIVASVTEYGPPFASSVRSGNVFACQFHPERSQEAGLRILGNFLG